ncbi:hypothetical protein F8388_002740 [Cannabis sativa]|uniref:Uncharacterized protein n=1 Tax=Cannabis sativa TaxID=3483 RepID=A0A7J6F7Z3_CANSA|nr:hypothetical protein F8388_002740 [Cannabis sativa]
MKYVTTQGTKSLAQRRHELVREPDYVSTWMEVHLKKDKQFVNEYARQDYERLQAIQAARSQIDTDSGSSPDQVSIFEEAFGQRRGQFVELVADTSTVSDTQDQGSPAHSQHSAASSDMHTSSTSQPQHLVPPLSQPLPQPSTPSNRLTLTWYGPPLSIHVRRNFAATSFCFLSRFD